MNTADTRAIEALLNDYRDAWQAQDMERWGHLFAPDADFVTWRGIRWYTGAQITDEHKTVPRHIADQMPNYEFTVDDVEPLAEGVALVHAHWDWPHFQEAEGGPEEDRHGLLTMVLMHRDGEWRIRASHNSRSDQA